MDHCDWVVVHFDCGGETPPPRGVGCERLQMRIFAIIPLIGEKQQGGVVNGRSTSSDGESEGASAEGSV